MGDRQRIRRGRAVSYNPTAAEAAVSGPGPYPALITDVDADGAVDLLVDTPGDLLGAGIGDLPAALDDPLVTSADGSDAGTTQTLANEMKGDLNVMVVLVNQLRDYQLNTRKNAVSRGSAAGQFDLNTGPQAL